MARRLNASQRAFLAAFEVSGRITSAAKAAGGDRRRHYEWLEDDAYKAAFEQASLRAGDHLEDEATRRAAEGVLQAEFYQGKACGTRRVYSDGLMMFLLRGMKPAKYRTTGQLEVTGKDGGAVALTVEFVRPK